jgi:hypothetical protein
MKYWLSKVTLDIILKYNKFYMCLNYIIFY